MTWLVPLFLLVVLLDMQNMIAPLRRIIRLGDDVSDDFTILIPLYGDPKYFRNGEFLAPYRTNVLLLVNVDGDKMAEFADALERDGWRVFRTHFAHKPCPPEMVRPALDAVTTTYAIRMDGDTWSDEHPGRAIAAIARDGADLCSSKVSVSRRERLVEKLQGLEYDMAMLGRHNRAWLTSGACIIGRTASLRQILDNHSLWFPGEDIETGLIAKHLRMKVRHVAFHVYTVAPDTFRSWFAQRRSWWCGHFRQTFVNCDKNLRYPLWVFYNLGLIWFLLYGKADARARALHLFPTVVLLYTLATLVANWSVRSRWMIAYPYYALMQAIVLPPFGLVQYVLAARRARRLGRFKIGMLRPPRVRAPAGTV